MTPDTSYIVPARNEEQYLPACLQAIAAQDTEESYEVIVVDDGSTDATADVAATHDVCVINETGRGPSYARNAGASAANGDRYAFIDADTIVAESHLTELTGFMVENSLEAATSLCVLPCGPRAKLMEYSLNHVLFSLPRPVLPGFNTIVTAEAFEAVGGFPHVPTEDTVFSQQIGKRFDTGVLRTVLVENSSRRIAETGLSGTAAHYVSRAIATRVQRRNRAWVVGTLRYRDG